MKTLPLLMLLSVLSPGLTRAEDTWSTPFQGVRMLHRKTSSPRRNIQVLVVDLKVPGVSLAATAPGEREQTTSSFAREVKAKAAINGDFFTSSYDPRGLAAGDGMLWPGSSDDTRYGTFVFGKGKRAELYQPKTVVKFDGAWMTDAVGGRPGVVAGGKVIDNADYGAHCTIQHPRTAVGLSEKKDVVYLVVVDGRASNRLGMTCNELGALMKGLGAYTALSLDGGGSTAMFVAGQGVVNFPSGGRERVVANHLAVFAPVVSAAPSDADGDAVPDAADNCPAAPNPAQEDLDGDGQGDACEDAPDAGTAPDAGVVTPPEEPLLPAEQGGDGGCGSSGAVLLFPAALASLALLRRRRR